MNALMATGFLSGDKADDAGGTEQPNINTPGRIKCHDLAGFIQDNISKMFLTGSNPQQLRDLKDGSGYDINHWNPSQRKPVSQFLLSEKATNFLPLIFI